MYRLKDLIAGAFLGINIDDANHNRVIVKDLTKPVTLSNIYVEDMSDLDGEVWLPITTWKGYDVLQGYYISNKGRVKHIPAQIDRVGMQNRSVSVGRSPRFLKTTVDYDGYLWVSIPTKSGEYKSGAIHRLVAAYFLGQGIPDGLEVNHIDGDKKNNCVDNLEWVTHSENMAHASAHGLARSGGGPQVMYCEELDSYFPSGQALANYLGVCPESLYQKVNHNKPLQTLQGTYHIYKVKGDHL